MKPEFIPFGSLLRLTHGRDMLSGSYILGCAGVVVGKWQYVLVNQALGTRWNDVAVSDTCGPEEGGFGISISDLKFTISQYFVKGFELVLRDYSGNETKVIPLVELLGRD